MTEAEELEYLRLKKRKAVATQATAAPARPQVNEQDIPYADMAPKKPINIDAALDGGSRNAVDIVADRFKRQAEVGGDFERKAMAERANQAGWDAQEQAGKQAESMSPIMRAMTGPAFDMSRQAGEKTVYNDAGVMTSADAMGVNILNSQALGAPGFASQGFRDKLRQAHTDQPGAAMAGEIAGMVGPGEAAFTGTKAAYNATLKPLLTRVLPKGSSKAAQATRFGLHGAEQAGTWAGQNALYRGTTGASVDAAMEGRAPTFDDVKSGALAGAKDPINLAGGLGGIGLSRTLRFLKTGGRTSVPTDRADFASGLAGRAPGSGRVLDAERFGDIDPLAEKQLLRLLDKFPAKDVRSALNSFEDASQGIVDEALLPTRLKDIFVEQLGDGAAGPIDDFLKGAGNSTGAPSARIVAEGVAQDRAALSQFVNDSANKRFGSGGRYETFKAAEQDLKEIGTQYENLFKPGAVVASPQDEQALREVVAFYAGDKEMMKYVSAQARKLKMTPEEFIESNPRRAAHMMQQVAREIADETPSKTMANAYGGIRDNLLQPLEAATPGYRQAREAFGDEYGFQQALGFANRFFTKAEDDIAVGLLAEEFAAMNPRQQEAAKIGMRDEALKFANRRTEGGSARLTKIGNEPSLAAMERVFGRDGAEFSNDLRATMARSDRNTYISAAGSNTANKQEAIKKAHEAVSNPLTRRIGNALQAVGVDSAATAMTGVPTPIMSARMALHGMGNALAKGRQGKIDNLTDLLMRDAGARPRAPMSGDGPVPTQKAAPVNALSQGADPVVSPARRFTRNDSGMVTPDAASALSTLGGAGVGAASAGDIDGDGKVTWKDRTAGAVIGGSLAYGARRGLGATADVMINSRVASAAVKRASGEAERILKDFPKPRTPGQPMTGDIMDDLLTVRLNQVLAEKGIDPEAFYRGSAKVDAKKFAPMQEAERRVIKDLSDLGYGMPQDQEWLRAIRTFTPKQYNKWQADDVSEMVAKFRQVQGKEMTPEVPAADGPRVLDSPGRAMVKPRPANDTKSSGLGGVRSDAGNALAGGVVGGAMPADNNQDRARNALIGAVGGGLAGRVGPKVSASSAGVGGKRPPKIKSDIPLGTPAKGKTKLPKSLAQMMTEPVPMQGIAKATGDAKTVMSARSSQATDMLAGGKTLTEIHKKTGLVPLEYKGGRVLIDSGDKGPDEVLAAFYQGAAMPQGKRPEWVQGVIDEIDTLVLDKPLPNTTPAGKGPRDRYAQNPDGTISKRKDDWKNPKGPVRGAGLLAVGAGTAGGVNALAMTEDKLNTGAERAAGYVKERLRTAELPKRPIDLLMESEIKRNKKGQFMRDMETKRKNDALWQRNGYTGYRGRKMTPEELRAQGKGSR